MADSTSHTPADDSKETIGFQAEAKQLLQLMIHSLYSNKEIFLRELISNASDAADKLRFEALNDNSLLEGGAELAIKIEFDKDNNTVTISDNGIGMSKQEVINNLGTIAKSGTAEFLKNMTGDEQKDSQLIGQFGVGFYSAFIVADRVEVLTRRAGTEISQGVYWESTGDADFNIANIEKHEKGTMVILHLRDEENDFADSWRLKSIVKKYSDHIAIPVMMIKEASQSMPTEDGAEPEPVVDAEPEFEAINDATALWTRSRSDVSDDEYKQFYKSISHDFEDPIKWSHNKVEGKFEYTSLLYIPKKAPFDLWNREYKHGLKLYVQRVFILDDAKSLLPTYLRFVKGVVDSNDLPLNVSREVLQSSSTVDMIRSGCVKRILDLLGYLAENEPDKYQKFWDAFGAVLKEGPAEDFANKDKIAGLLRFTSTQCEDEKQTLSLDNYLERMIEGQDKIYYVTADSYQSAKNSPHLELFENKGIEVLLLSDRVDEWLVSRLSEYKDKQLVSVARGDIGDNELKLDDQEEDELKKTEADFEDILKRTKEVLKDRVKDVRLSKRLTSSASCIVADEDEMSVNLRRMLIESGQSVPEVKPILELNVKHDLLMRLKTEMQDDQFANLANVLLDQAILSEGGQLDNPAAFVKRMNDLM